jgi:hypothetical protein
MTEHTEPIYYMKTGDNYFESILLTTKNNSNNDFVLCTGSKYNEKYTYYQYAYFYLDKNQNFTITEEVFDLDNENYYYRGEDLEWVSTKEWQEDKALCRRGLVLAVNPEKNYKPNTYFISNIYEPNKFYKKTKEKVLSIENGYDKNKKYYIKSNKSLDLKYEDFYEGNKILEKVFAIDKQGNKISAVTACPIGTPRDGITYYYRYLEKL